MLFILPLGLFNNVCWAEEDNAPVAKTSSSSSDVIYHLDKATPFLENGDVANATAHIKHARTAVQDIPGDSPAVNQH